MTELEILLNKIQGLKLKKEAAAELYDDHIKILTAQLEGMCKASGTENVSTEMATAYFQTNTSVNVEDWNVVMKFVADNNAFDILQRRISPAQLEARIKAGAKIDGITIEKTKSLQIRGKKDAPKER